MAQEGIGPIGAALLYATLGTGEACKTGIEFSAYLGLTPTQKTAVSGKRILLESRSGPLTDDYVPC